MLQKEKENEEKREREKGHASGWLAGDPVQINLGFDPRNLPTATNEKNLTIPKKLYTKCEELTNLSSDPPHKILIKDQGKCPN